MSGGQLSGGQLSGGQLSGGQLSRYLIVYIHSDRPGVRFQPGSNFLAGAGSIDSGRAGEFWSRFGAQSDLLK